MTRKTRRDNAFDMAERVASRSLCRSGVDQLEEQVAAAGNDRQIADFIGDQQLRPAQEAQRSIGSR
jgi:hypothetical protein